MVTDSDKPVPEQPKYQFPDISNQGPAFIVDASKTLWIGIPTKLIKEYHEAAAVLDHMKLQVLGLYKQQSQSRLIQPLQAARDMKNFITGKFK